MGEMQFDWGADTRDIDVLTVDEFMLGGCSGSAGGIEEGLLKVSGLASFEGKEDVFTT